MLRPWMLASSDSLSSSLEDVFIPAQLVPRTATMPRLSFLRVHEIHSPHCQMKQLDEPVPLEQLADDLAQHFCKGILPHLQEIADKGLRELFLLINLKNVPNTCTFHFNARETSSDTRVTVKENPRYTFEGEETLLEAQWSNEFESPGVKKDSANENQHLISVECRSSVNTYLLPRIVQWAAELHIRPENANFLIELDFCILN
ncbi:hypothetical protein Ciccas_000509 [Cichlidogyrus casuarinus]|uniref:Uncharacterized protein n=1 Tax=Cichlidogyrus casuarinus TaxID=1844966 RepID=A0ABD2QMV4_9PLAT